MNIYEMRNDMTWQMLWRTFMMGNGLAVTAIAYIKIISGKYVPSIHRVYTEKKNVLNQ